MQQSSASWRAGVLAIGMLGWAVSAGSAFAQAELSRGASHASSARLVVLRSAADSVPASLRAQVDEELLQALATRTSFSAMVGSPIPFEDVELAAGCRARDTECMRRISATLGGDWFMIRELSRDASGRVYMSLTAHDGPQAEVTRRMIAEVAPDGAHAPARVVPGAIDELYAEQLLAPGMRPAGSRVEARAPSDQAVSNTLAPHAGPAQAAEREGSTGSGAASRQDERHPGVSVAGATVGWTATVIGGGLLAAGTVMGVLSQRDNRAYRNALIETPEDVEWADARLDRARDRARNANVLLIGGAAASAVGVASLLWTYFRPRPTSDVHSVALEVAPVRAGAGLSLHGRWRGGL